MSARADYPRAAGALAWSVLSDDRGYIVGDLLKMFAEIDHLRAENEEFRSQFRDADEIAAEMAAWIGAGNRGMPPGWEPVEENPA